MNKKIETQHGVVKTETTITTTDSGQTILHVKGVLDGHVHEHRITVGAADGNDALGEMTEEQMGENIQAHLNSVREKVAAVLTSRKRVRNHVENLT
jgi:hypothetical protein